MWPWLGSRQDSNHESPLAIFDDDLRARSYSYRKRGEVVGRFSVRDMNDVLRHTLIILLYERMVRLPVMVREGSYLKSKFEKRA
jgi:hypothetical protein